MFKNISSQAGQVTIMSKRWIVTDWKVTFKVIVELLF